jgi:hypothetical protein
MFSEKTPKKCEDCPILAEKMGDILENVDSVFDAVSDLDKFLEKCLETCSKKDE